jgi:hypothetical protein
MGVKLKDIVEPESIGFKDLEGRVVSIDAFKETVLKRENESRRIDEFFPGFLEWSISEGKKNSDWYMNHLSPVEQTEIDQP